MSLCADGNARFELQTSSQRPGGPKATSYQDEVEAEDTSFAGGPVGPSRAEKAREAAAARSKTLRAAPDNDMLLAFCSL